MVKYIIISRKPDALGDLQMLDVTALETQG